MTAFWSLCMYSKHKNLDNPVLESNRFDSHHIYFEFELEEKDFGKERRDHDGICNQVLLSYLEELSSVGVELCETVSNAELIETIRNNPKDNLHESLT